MIENGTTTEHQAEMARRDCYSDLSLEMHANVIRSDPINFMLFQVIKMYLIMFFTMRFGYWPGYIFGCAVWLLSMQIGL